CRRVKRRRGAAGHFEKQPVLRQYGGRCGVLRTPGKRRDRSDDYYVILLCILFRYDVVGCGVWSDRSCCMRDPGGEISKDVSGNEEVIKTLFLLWAFNDRLGGSVWRIFRKYCRYCLGEILRDDNHTAGAVVCSP